MSKFLNPYNFISFPPKKEGVYKKDEMKCHTGVIHYTVTTKSPLFIPNSSADAVFEQSTQADKHKSYDFFSYTQLSPYAKTKKDPEAPTPVIPGSEMRGVIRSVYETLTDSCMGVLNSDTLPVKRSANQFEPGLIRKEGGEYTLIKAESFRIGKKARKNELPPGFEDKRNGTLICYKDPQEGTLIDQSYVFGRDENSEYDKEGYLLKWGMGAKKGRYHLYSPIEKEGTEQVVTGTELDEYILETKLVGVIESYMDCLSVGKEDSENQDLKAYKEYKQDLKEFMNDSSEDTGYFPVNYSVLLEEEGKFYLSPAIFTKEISNNSIGTLARDFAPCSGVTECPACELFGHVSENGNYSRGSKVRFSDLYVEEERDNREYFYDVCTLPALSSPKLGNVEFYMKKPGKATSWTYDYYVENGQVKIEQDMLELRGRKYYWHHPQKEKASDGTLPSIPSGIKPDRLNKTVRPLQRGVTFSGELYFEGISDKQLKQLVWICNSGVEELGYKLGAAKPFGFGSVVCEVTAVEERDIEIRDGNVVYSKSGNQKDKYSCSYEKAGFSEHCKGQFYRIAGLYSINEGTKITYPKTQQQINDGGENEGFRWYVQNHRTIS